MHIACNNKFLHLSKKLFTNSGLTAFFFIFIQFFQISFSDVFMNTRLAIFIETYNVFDITSVSSRVGFIKILSSSH